MEMDQKDCSMKVQKMIEKYAWIASEKQLFGKSGTDYDFSSNDPYKAKEEFEKLQAELSGYGILPIFHSVHSLPWKSFFPLKTGKVLILCLPFTS